MRVVLMLSAAVLVAVSATWAYRVNYATRAALGRVEHLRAEIARERERLAVLRAEWAYLNRPDRLRALVILHNDALELTDLTPEQFGEPAMVAYPPDPLDAPDAVDAAAGAEE